MAPTASAQRGEPEAPAAQPAAAADDATAARARTLFEQGVADYAAERYEQALANFQEAHRIKPHPMVRVNMANCYDKLGKPLQALIHFERFLEADAGSPEQRAEIKAAIARLSKQVASVSLQVSPDGAAVVFDGGDRRTSPIAEPVRLTAGAHQLVVSLEGYATDTRALELKGGVTTEVAISLQPAAAAPAPTPVAAAEPPPSAEPAPQPGTPEPADAEQAQAAREAIDAATAPAPQEPRRSRIDVGVWIAGGATAALLMGATITGTLAVDAENDFRAHRAALFDTTNSTTFERIDAYNEARDAADRANALALTTDILFGGALIAGALTTYLIFNGSSNEARTELSPILSPEVAGVRFKRSL